MGPERNLDSSSIYPTSYVQLAFRVLFSATCIQCSLTGGLSLPLMQRPSTLASVIRGCAPERTVGRVAVARGPALVRAVERVAMLLGMLGWKTLNCGCTGPR